MVALPKTALNGRPGAETDRVTVGLGESGKVLVAPLKTAPKWTARSDRTVGKRRN